jgi:hypothetical protein
LKEGYIKGVQRGAEGVGHLANLAVFGEVVFGGFGGLGELFAESFYFMEGLSVIANPEREGFSVEFGCAEAVEEGN